tara:strand:+ start:292 stop:516 length:225 start_codon:yes stop_codon:yes gene_type:complete
MHKMSKDSANQLAAVYAQVAKYREAFDICIKYIEILYNCKDSWDCQTTVHEFREELLAKVGINTFEEFDGVKHE